MLKSNQATQLNMSTTNARTKKGIHAMNRNRIQNGGKSGESPWQYIVHHSVWRLMDQQ